MNTFGIIGKSLSHSFSKKYFDDKFEKENIVNSEFKIFELENIEDIKTILKTNSNLKGFSVTIPYKEAIIPYLDETDDMVKEIGACNCVTVDNGKLKGYNTDAHGFLASFLSMYEMHYFKAIILGNGGASKAIQYAFGELSIDSIVVARKPRNKNEIKWSELNKNHFSDLNIVVNATPLGTFPNNEEFPDIPYSIFSEHFLAFDLVYNPEETTFLKKAKEYNAQTINGYDMLVNQAEFAWKNWNS